MKRDDPTNFWTGLDWLKLAGFWAVVLLALIVVERFFGFWPTSWGFVALMALGFVIWLYWPQRR